MADENPVHAFYEDYWARPEDAAPTHDPSRGVRLRLLEHDLQRIQPGSLVDAGCGSGWTVQRLRRRGYGVIGLDISAAAVREACRQDVGGTYIQAVLDGPPWPLESCQADVVYSFEVIEHLMLVGAFFRECRRILRPQGFVALTTPFHGIIKNLILAVVGFDKHFAVEGAHIRFFTVSSLTRTLDQAGFRIVAIQYYGRIRPISEGMYVLAQKVD